MLHHTNLWWHTCYIILTYDVTGSLSEVLRKTRNFCQNGGSQNRHWGVNFRKFREIRWGPRKIAKSGGGPISKKSRLGQILQNFRERREIFGMVSRSKSVVDRNFAKKIKHGPSRNCDWRFYKIIFRIVTALAKNFWYYDEKFLQNISKKNKNVIKKFMLMLFYKFFYDCCRCVITFL